MLLVGAPGCGKSLLLDSVLAWTGGTKFSILLTKFTVPEETCGPVSLAALKADRYVRVTAGKLPEADFAYVDEVFKASSAILNTLLRILNERVYDAGDGVARMVPLKLCVAASNEWPAPDTGKELAALLDRFTLRKAVAPIRSQAGRQRLLWARDHAPTFSATVSPAEVEQARRAAQALPWSADAKEALEAVLKELAKEGVRPGDRRQFKTVGVVRAFAYLNGADEVRPEHLEVAQHTLWDDPQEQPQAAARVIARVANRTTARRPPQRPVFRPRIEGLEDRWVPTLLQLTGGNIDAAASVSAKLYGQVYTDSQSTSIPSTDFPTYTNQIITPFLRAEAGEGRAQETLDIEHFPDGGAYNEMASLSIRAAIDQGEGALPSPDVSHATYEVAQKTATPIAVTISPDHGYLNGDKLRLVLQPSAGKAPFFEPGDPGLTWRYSLTLDDGSGQSVDFSQTGTGNESVNDQTSLTSEVTVGDALALGYSLAYSGTTSLPASGLRVSATLSVAVPRPDLSVGNLRIESGANGTLAVKVSTQVADQYLPSDGSGNSTGKLAFYWATGPTFAARIGDPAYEAKLGQTPQTANTDWSVPFDDLDAEPANATYLLAVVDPDQEIGESIETNNVAAYSVPPPPDTTPFPTGSFGAADIAVAPDGTVWFDSVFPAYGKQLLGRISPQGVITTFSYPGAVTGSFRGVTVGPDGNIWVCEGDLGRVAKISPAGVMLAEYASPTPGASPYTTGVGPDGNIWFTDEPSNQIGRITPQGQVTVFDVPTPNAVPLLPTAGPNNTLWFTEEAGNRISRISFNAPPTALAGGPYTTTYGNGVTLDASGSSDPDGDPLTYSWTINGHAGAATGVSPALSWATLAGLGLVPGNSYPVTVTIDDGQGHTVTAPSTTVAVGKATPTASVVPVPRAPYTGQGHGTTGAVVGVGGAVLSSTVTYTDDQGNVLGGAPVHPGTYTATVSFTGDANYNPASSGTPIVIDKADAVITISPYSGTYDGQSHGLAGTAKGVFGEDLGSLLNLGGTDTNAGTYTIGWSFAGNADYNGVTGRSSTVAIARAPLTVQVGSLTKTYGQALDLASVLPDAVPTGINGETLAVSYVSDGAAALAPVQAGGYPITAQLSDGTGRVSNYVLTVLPGVLTVDKATPSFGVTGTTVITDGTASVTLTGTLSDGDIIPTGSVTVTVDGVSQPVAIGADGSFSATFATATLSVGVHTVRFDYGGDQDFTDAHATASLDDTYGVIALFNQTQAKHAGSMLPIQIALAAAGGRDVSSAGITVTALGIAATTDTGDPIGAIDPAQVGALTPVQAAGNSNLGNVFRYQAGANPSYTYNLKIPAGLAAGTYRLYFSVSGDPLDHWVTFTVV